MFAITSLLLVCVSWANAGLIDPRAWANGACSPGSDCSVQATIANIERQWKEIDFPTAHEIRVRGRPFTVNVEGIVGAGKSTFLSYFEPYDIVDVLPEPVEKWENLNGTDLLQKIYEDPKQWAFTHECYVFLTMLEEHLRNTGAPIKMMERSMHSGRFVFAEHFHNDGKLKDYEFEILKKWYDMLNYDIPGVDLTPDLTIYLRNEPNIVIERIKQRGRDEEKTIKMEFLYELFNLHEAWLMDKDNGIPQRSKKLIVIDTSGSYDDMQTIYKTVAKKFMEDLPQDLKDMKPC